MFEVYASGIGIENERCFNQVAVVLQQPVNAIRLAPLLVGGKRQDEIAVRLIALLLKANECGHQDGVTLLHVLGATPVEVAVLLDKLKWIGGPIRAQRLNYVEVTDKENWLSPARPMNARYHVALAFIGAEDEDIFFGKPGVQQTLRHGFCGNCRIAHGIGGVDFDELLEDIA